MYFLLLLNLIMPFVMVLVGNILKKYPVTNMKSSNGYNTPISRKSQQHWDYAQRIAPDNFISLGKVLGTIEIILNAIMLLLRISIYTALNVGVIIGVVFLILGFYKTDMEIEKAVTKQ